MKDHDFLHTEAAKFEELRRRIVSADPDIDEKTLFDTLEGATDLHEAVAAVIRSALDDEALAKALRARIEDMRQRLSRIESTAEAKREAALNAMERADMIKLTAPDFTVSIRINPPSLVITSEAEIPQEFLGAATAQAQQKGIARRHQQRLGGAWCQSLQLQDLPRHQDQITWLSLRAQLRN